MKKSLSVADTQPVSNTLLAILAVSVLAISVVGCAESSSNDALASSELHSAAAPDPATSPVAATAVGSGAADAKEAGWLNKFDAVSANGETAPKPGRTPIEGELVDPEGDVSNVDAQDDEPELPDMKVRQRSKIRSGGVLDLTFDDVEFEIEKDADFDRSMLTPEIEAMHGKEVIIRGFVLESYQIKNIKEFVLVRDNQECCFGPGAFIYHNMQVEMVGDARAEYTIRPITIQGKFTIKPFVIDGKCYSVFHVAATKFQK